mmetsp:Transcript_14491/g.23622  ORF Transcript_14491/g.23622 Transcript_14491/m.23622 type:complete len:167 (+) Transcript_14491:281-781(+)
MMAGPITLKTTTFKLKGAGALATMLVSLLLNTAVAAETSDASGHDVHGAAMLIRCTVCTQLVAHLETELQGWRPLKVTESAVRSLVDGACAIDHSTAFLERSLLKDAVLLHDKENHNYILQNNTTDDPSGRYDIERFTRMPSGFVTETVTDACNAILDNHHKEVGS